MSCHGIKDSFKVKEEFHLGTSFDSKGLRRKVTHACSYEALPSYAGVWCSEIKRATIAQMSERLEQGFASLADAMGRDEGQYMTRKMIDHAIMIHETVSLLLGYPCAIPTPSHYLSLGTPRSVIEQWEIGRSSTNAK